VFAGQGGTRRSGLQSVVPSSPRLALPKYAPGIAHVQQICTERKNNATPDIAPHVTVPDPVPMLAIRKHFEKRPPVKKETFEKTKGHLSD
jgi:hypothetical protein